MVYLMNVNFGENYIPVRYLSGILQALVWEKKNFPLNGSEKVSFLCHVVNYSGFCMSNGFGLIDFGINPWGKSQVLPFLYEIKDTTVFWYEKGFTMFAKNAVSPLTV